MKAQFRSRPKFKLVTKIYGLDHGPYLMEAIGTLPQDREGEIHFGKGANLDEGGCH